MRFSERWRTEAANGFAAARDAGVASTLDAFLQDFRALRRFPPNDVRELRLSAEFSRFLVEEGLPEEAAPWVALESSKRVLRPISQIWPLSLDARRDVELEHCYSLYTDGSGNPIVINRARDGALTLLDHEASLKEVCYVNASVIAFAECLLIRMKALSRHEMIRAIGTLDPDAIVPGTFWHTHLAGLPTSR
jgi:hypothetical protein